ncbi:MAG: hypothetical protein JXR37_22760 [Kiritimatiellae bacterium]|nr:hypothetical protein [Kiritimatiellia bacterium]
MKITLGFCFPRARLAVSLALAHGLAAAAAQPSVRTWISRGVGGGGAFYTPAISPHDPAVLFAQSDMRPLFRSVDGGAFWQTLDFRQIQGGIFPCGVQFTREPDLLYALDYAAVALDDAVTPAMSTDGGLSWSGLIGDPTGHGAYSLFADGNATNRLLVSSYDAIYFSDDCGQSFALKFATNDCHVAGAFFDAARIFVGTRAGLLVSTNGGASFALSGIGGIPGTEAVVSFAGARQNGTTRLFCVTLGDGDVYPGVTGADYDTYRCVYALDYGVSPQWTAVTNGFGEDHPFFVGMSTNNIDIACVAGAQHSPTYPVVYRTVNGGGSWQKVLRAASNENVYTGWSGDGGDSSWWYGEYALGFAVCPADPAVMAVGDLGFVHGTTNGGAAWRQLYVHPDDQNPTNAPTPQRRYYHGIGLEDTSCWWLTWTAPSNLFASFTDIGGIRTTNAGLSWAFDYTGNAYNTTYHCLLHPTNHFLYAAVSTVHDLYQSTYLLDSAIDDEGGEVLCSTNEGAAWQTLHDFAHPVYALGLDPGDPDRLYACVVHSSEGGIYRTTNLHAGAAATWTKLAAPPRTEGHPCAIHVLDDGTLVCAYSGRRNSSEAFTASSGVFVSTNGGGAWLDRSDPGMLYWTKDLVLDPHDASQQTWYACVFSGWGGPPNDLGGLYRTADRGLSWTRLAAPHRAESCAVDPLDRDQLYLSTEVEGLWFTTNATTTSPSFDVVQAYPFAHPVRLFFNPYDTNEIWATSFGNGVRLGRRAEPAPHFTASAWADEDGVRVGIGAAAGQRLILETSTNLADWVPLATQTVFETGVVFSDPAASNFTHRYYQATVAE